VNISLTDDFLAAHLNGLTDDARLGVARKPAETVILDYGGPNIAKPMHVGHLRSSIIGDALRRLFRFVGDRAVGDVHLGDWGLPMGQIIAESRAGSRTSLISIRRRAARIRRRAR
jgi:arginyl-tRNA synthetase